MMVWGRVVDISQPELYDKINTQARVHLTTSACALFDALSLKA